MVYSIYFTSNNSLTPLNISCIISGSYTFFKKKSSLLQAEYHSKMRQKMTKDNFLQQLTNFLRQFIIRKLNLGK